MPVVWVQILLLLIARIYPPRSASAARPDGRELARRREQVGARIRARQMADAQESKWLMRKKESVPDLSMDSWGFI
jgi:hypothetical protein